MKALAAAGLLTLNAALSLAADAPEIHRLKSPDAPSGSRINGVDASWVVPFDKRYAELTPQQQTLLKSQYESMGPDDEPPFPVDGLAPVHRAIAAVSRKIGTLGDLSLAVKVDAKGEADSVSVLKASDPDFTRAVATILMLQKYKPALCKGVPCVMEMPFRMNVAR